MCRSCLSLLSMVAFWTRHASRAMLCGLLRPFGVQVSRTAVNCTFHVEIDNRSCHRIALYCRRVGGRPSVEASLFHLNNDRRANGSVG